jgi:hypothetical protein
VAFVEVLGIAAVQPLHSGGDVASRRLHDEMDVVRHEAVQVEDPAAAKLERREHAPIDGAVFVVEEDRGAVVPARRNVVETAGELDAKRTWHAADRTCTKRRRPTGPRSRYRHVRGLTPDSAGAELSSPLTGA